MKTKKGKCGCACHKNLLRKKYLHDTKCCNEMNGITVEDKREIRKAMSTKQPRKEKDLEKLVDCIFEGVDEAPTKTYDSKPLALVQAEFVARAILKKYTLTKKIK